MNKDTQTSNPLLGGGLDPELMESLAQSGAINVQASSPTADSIDSDVQAWEDFMRHLDHPVSSEYKESRHVCKLDKELSDTLDELNIKGKSRSDMVNAIVRTFFDRHLDRMSEYRQERKSLFKKMREKLR